jgi:xylose isomerase
MVFFCDDRRRESTDVEDLFLAHISGMDTLARGLRNAAKLIEVITENNHETCRTFSHALFFFVCKAGSFVL